MKVLLTSHGAGPYGAERVLMALARGLAARGHQVVMDFPHEGPAVEASRTLEGVRVLVGRRRRLPRNALEAARYVLGLIPTVVAIRRVARSVEPDVVWVNSLYNAPAALAARLAGADAVWHLHERNLRSLPSLLVAAAIGGTGARAVAVSDYIGHTYRRFPFITRRVTTLHNPLLARKEPFPLRHGSPFTVGYVGQLEPRKRAPDLARALVHVPDAHGVFVGDGKARNRLERTVSENGLQERVRLLGFRENVHAELGGFDCLSIPSLREPFGLVALEAMAAGVPVVAARSGALPEVLGDAALYHAPTDPRDLGRQIETLRQRPDLRAELRERGLERILRYDPTRWLDAVEGILHEVARKGG